MKDKNVNITGQSFGRLTAIEKVGQDKCHNNMWLFKCSCGNLHKATYTNVIKGICNSCGCLNKQINSKRSFVPIDGQRFGNCVAIKRVEDMICGKQKLVAYECECDCGKIFIARKSNLTNGHTWCCGCKKKSSKGETFIKYYLQKRHIEFEKEITFDNLRSCKGYKLRFDFGIYKNGSLLFLLEYQGEQHFNTRKNEVFGVEQKETDKIKASYCKDKNINLFYIKYNEDIYEKLEEILNTHYYDNPVPSSDISEKV